MKKLKLFTILLVFLFAVFSFGDYRDHKDFLATAEASIASTATATNGSEFDSETIVVQTEVIAITITFTIVAANGDDIDFYFQASHDNGVTWSSDEYFIVDCASDVSTAGTPVYHTEEKLVGGISHLRLWKVVNGDTVTAITAVNATASWGKL